MQLTLLKTKIVLFTTLDFLNSHIKPLKFITF